MKTKKLERKLSLNKETIASLDAIEMKDVYAGALAQSDAISCGGVCIISAVETGCCTFTCPPKG